jgi:hypothetical protein
VPSAVQICHCFMAVMQEVTLEKELERTDAEAMWAKNRDWRRTNYDN